MERLKTNILQYIRQAGGTWGVVIEDVTRRESIAINPHELFTAESIIKVPIMAAVFAAARQGKIGMRDQLALKQEEMVGGSGVLFCLTPGLRLSVYDLVMLMIIQSDNTATNMLIDLIGSEQIRQTMRELGMTESRFRKKLMTYPVDIPEKNVITPADLAVLLRKLASGEYLSRDACDEMVAIMKKQQVRNGLPAYLPPNGADGSAAGETGPSWELANKTGWDTGSQHDVGIFFCNNRTFTVTALSKDVDSHTALDTLGKIGRDLYLYAREK